MARYQHPNPLDLLFFAGEHALRRAGLPGAHLHMHLELGGLLNLDRFRHAVRALHRVYPVTGARQQVSLCTGHPRWRLDGPPPDLRHVVHLHRVTPPIDEQLQDQIGRLFAAPLDTVRRPPVQFHVFRGMPRGDVLILRWPHTLMDGRGAYRILEELDRLYEEAPELHTLHSAGDERRADFAQLLSRYPLPRRLQMLGALRRDANATPGKVVQLAAGPVRRPLGAMRTLFRFLTPDDTQHVAENARRLAGTWPTGDYLRACAVRALSRIMPAPVPPDAVYTTNALLDNRRKAAPAVCWNLSSALPVAVPAAAAQDCARMTRLFRRQMIAHVRARSALRYYAAFSLLTRPPTACVAAAMKGRLLGLGGGDRDLGLTAAPSLRLDFIGPFSRPLPTFCGVELRNHYGYSTLLPRPGFALHVNLTHTRLNISGVCLESRVPPTTLSQFIDLFIATLIEPR